MVLFFFLCKLNKIIFEIYAVDSFQNNDVFGVKHISTALVSSLNNFPIANEVYTIPNLLN